MEDPYKSTSVQMQETNNSTSIQMEETPSFLLDHIREQKEKLAKMTQQVVTKLD